MTLRDQLPVRLREMRERAGLTQVQLADRLMADNVQISRYETGAIVPSLETLTKIADILECSTDYLLGRSDTAQIAGLQAADLSSDERRIIEAIRHQDIAGALVAFSLLVPRYNPGAEYDEVAMARRREMREERERRNRERHAKRREAAHGVPIKQHGVPMKKDD